MINQVTQNGNCHARIDCVVARSVLSVYNVFMDKLKQLIERMENAMREDLKKSGDLEEYGEEGIRIAVYEDLKDSLNHLFSDILYK